MRPFSSWHVSLECKGGHRGGLAEMPLWAICGRQQDDAKVIAACRRSTRHAKKNTARRARGLSVKSCHPDVETLALSEVLVRYRSSPGRRFPLVIAP